MPADGIGVVKYFPTFRNDLSHSYQRQMIAVFVQPRYYTSQVALDECLFQNVSQFRFQPLDFASRKFSYFDLGNVRHSTPSAVVHQG